MFADRAGSGSAPSLTKSTWSPRKSGIALLAAVVLALGVILVIRMTRSSDDWSPALREYSMPSASMQPTIPVGSRFVVKEPDWSTGSPGRGDVVVFKDPGGWLSTAEDGQGVLLTKRIVGVPGDTIHCCNGQGHLEVNGQAIDEDSFLDEDRGSCDATISSVLVKKGSSFLAACDWTVGPVPEGQLFVLGDNRMDSADSRFHLCSPGTQTCTESPWVPERLVVGVAVTVFPPGSGAVSLHRPSAFAAVPAP